MSSGQSNASKLRRQWRFYATESGRKPDEEYLSKLPQPDMAEVAAAMRDVAKLSPREVAKHLRGQRAGQRSIR